MFKFLKNINIPKSNVKIFENRDLKGKIINEYLVNQNPYEVVIDLNDQEKRSINQRLVEGISKILNDDISDGINKKLTLENTEISRSKNYVPTMPDQLREWEWHSWNVLTKKKANSDKDYFLFAVKLDEDRYACMLFTNEKFKKLLNEKKLTPDERYFFYFAKKSHY